MIGIGLTLIILAAFVIYLSFYRGRLFLLYPLIAYIVLWPRFMDELKIVPIKGEFGSLQVGDLFFIVFILLLFFRFFTRDILVNLKSYRWALIFVSLFVVYWIIRLFVTYEHEFAKGVLNQFRFYVYYLFLFFIAIRIRTQEDVINIIKAIFILSIIAFAFEMIFVGLHNIPSMRSFFYHRTPMFYKEVYVERRFILLNFKNLFIFFPFLLNTVFLRGRLGFNKMLSFIGVGCISFIMLLCQSRAMWLVLIFGSLISVFLLFLKGKFSLFQHMKSFVLFLLLAIFVLVFLVVGTSFTPKLTKALQDRIDSISIAKVTGYQKGKEMGSLKSRIESYKLVFRKVEGYYIFGKGLGALIDPYGGFHFFIDSTYLMTLWNGGLFALLLLLTFQLFVFSRSLTGYFRSITDFDIYFFTSSTVSLLNTYVLALQDRILSSGNSIIMFLILVAMMLFMRKAQLNMVNKDMQS